MAENRTASTLKAINVRLLGFFPNYSFSPLGGKIRCYPRSFVVRVTRSWKIEAVRAGITETLSSSSLNDNGQGTPGTLKSSLLLSINN